MKNKQKRLLELYTDLDQEQQGQILDFAEFLHHRYPSAAKPPQTPQPIPRPERESVVAAMKRLSATYPMLNKSKVLHHASSLVSQHILGGRSATAVIDDLEVLFERLYQDLSSAPTDTEKNGHPP